MRADQQPKVEQERLEAERRALERGNQQQEPERLRAEHRQRAEQERLQAEQREREPLEAQRREHQEKGQREAECREIGARGGMGADSRASPRSGTPHQKGALNLKKLWRLLAVIGSGVAVVLLGFSLYSSYRVKTLRARPVLVAPFGTPPPIAPSNSPRSSPSGADWLAEAKRHLDAKGYVRALPPLQKAADGGNAEALYRLGWLYENGWGVDQDPTKARERYQKAADAGDAEAKEALSQQRSNRSPIPVISSSPASQPSPSATPPGADGLAEAKRYLATKDYAKALPLLQTAALLGDAWGMNQLGVLYDDGHGVVQDYAQARQWYQKAAQAGNTDAMVNLGSLYYQGHGVAQDDGQARRWYQQAAQAGNADAKGVLLHFGADRLAKAKRYLEAKDYLQARRWYQKAAEAGNPKGMVTLGMLYANEKDYAQARQWFQRAADAGDAEAMTKLGALYVNDKNDAQARGWFQKAAGAGNAEAMTELGVLYQFGQGGVARDYAQARRWYRKAAEGGSPQGMFNLGYLYEQGLGVARDYGQARRWYQKAADAGNAQAKEALLRLPLK